MLEPGGGGDESKNRWFGGGMCPLQEVELTVGGAMEVSRIYPLPIAINTARFYTSTHSTTLH